MLRSNSGYFLPLTSCMSMAFDGQFRQQSPQPMHWSSFSMGCPLNFSSICAFSKGYLLVAGLVRVFSAAFLRTEGMCGFFGIVFNFDGFLCI